MTDSDARLEALETKLAFQEDTIAQLSDALVAQQSRIDGLQARLERLVEQVALAQQDDEGSPEPPPPHY